MSASAEDFSIEIHGWDDLAGLVDHFSRYIGHDWLFRGVTDASHELIPKVGRPTSRRQTPADKALEYSEAHERAIFEMFKQQARAYVPNPPSSDLEWLAIGQHHGLPTRLLDWTEGLLVSAWFAVVKGGAKQCDSAIWITKGIPSVHAELQLDPFQVEQTVAFRAPYITPRIGAQGSVLVVCPQPNLPLGLTFVRRIVIKRTAEFTIRKRLDACGINERSLFPDLGGLGAHLGWLYKHGWLAGRTPPSSFWEPDVGRLGSPATS